jgi:hypothetical protein
MYTLTTDFENGFIGFSLVKTTTGENVGARRKDSIQLAVLAW